MRYIYSHDHCSIIHNSQAKEITYISINSRMDKEDMHTGMLSIQKKEGNLVICHNMDDLQMFHFKHEKTKQGEGLATCQKSSGC